MAAGASTDPYERLAEAVRNYSVLHDKVSADFKDNNKRRLAWEDVSVAVGVSNGEFLVPMWLLLLLLNKRTSSKIRLRIPLRPLCWNQVRAKWQPGHAIARNFYASALAYVTLCLCSSHV